MINHRANTCTGSRFARSSAGAASALILLATAVLLPAPPAAAQYQPPAGAGDVLELYSPRFLAGGAPVTSLESPTGDVINPAASAAKQRVSVDLSYIGIADFTGATSGLGSAINTGITIPTRAGVFSSSLHYVSSGLAAIDIGPQGALNASFAKDLFPDLYVGLGVGAQIGADAGAFAWGLSADLGLIHLLGDVGFMKDLRWGLALRGLGKGFRPANTTQGTYPAAFTPQLGVGFNLIRTDPVMLGTTFDLTAPSLGDLRADLGLELAIADLVFLHGRVPFSLVETTSGGSTRFPVTFGLTVKFQTALQEDTQLLGIGERGWARSEVQTHATVAPIRDGLWGSGLGANIALGVVDREPPRIVLGAGAASDEPLYRSPNLDGIQDDLELPVSITDRRFVMGYRLVIENADGEMVREIRNKDERPENEGLQRVLDRLFYVDSGITVPETVRWDGRATTGTVVADGVYSYYVEAWDDNANVGTSAPRTVVIDNSAPAVTVEAPYLVFSPNDDGNKDTLPIAQTGTVEGNWQAQIVTPSGDRVASFTWANAAPPAFEWDGRSSDGTLAADGVYAYQVTTTDRAGNSVQAQLSNIIINTQSTPIAVTVDDAIFSPNGDGVQDVINYRFDVPVTSGIERWSLQLSDAGGTVVRTIRGGAEIPAQVRFEGTGDDGARLAEGSYVARLELQYTNGNRPQAQAPAVTVDLTAPAAAVRADLALFSPDGDGNKDRVTLFQETSEEVAWTGTVRGAFGVAVRSETWRGVAEPSYIWDGRRADGLLAEDGEYRYIVEATDRAGNVGRSNEVVVVLDTAETPVFLTADATHFSPNGDQVSDRLTLVPRLEETTGIERYTLQVNAVASVNADGAATLGPVVRTLTGRGSVPERIVWDGLDDGGNLVADGQYLAQLEVLYTKGNNPSGRTGTFAIDTELPQATIATSYTLFSPDGDGERDLLTVEQSSSEETLWEGEVLDATGEALRSYFWKGRLTPVQWNGNDENGNRVPDGTYRYRVTATDAAGNTASATIEDIRIDTRATPLFITAEVEGFSPNDDGVSDEQVIGIVTGLTEGIRSWELQIVHQERGPQRVLTGTGAVPTRVEWDGRTNIDSAAPDGMYVAEIAIDYLKGNKPRERTSAFRLDRSPPRVALDLSPKPFSPDNDGVDDELVIGIEVEDLSPIVAWTLRIVDPVGTKFAEFGGQGRPTEAIIWDGVSDSGELVQAAEDYAVQLSLRDDLGNATSVEDVIPVDVLVLRDGDKLKIRIASITFPADSADLGAVDDLQKRLKNETTIERLAEIFDRYSRYTIRIEGHANNLSYTDAEAAAREQREELVPLSTERADAVKQALVGLGLDADRISTAGLGGSAPVVPFSDEENRWKNRRVEFVLTSR